jgi:hypothetical protein
MEPNRIRQQGGSESRSLEHDRPIGTEPVSARRDYNIAAIVRENFYHAPGWGWRASTEADAPDAFVASLRRNLRKRARV